MWDKFNRVIVTNDDGTSSCELVETEPVCSLASRVAPEAEHVIIELYCNTDSGGNGYHYEWIQILCGSDGMPPNFREEADSLSVGSVLPLDRKTDTDMPDVLSEDAADESSTSSSAGASLSDDEPGSDTSDAFHVSVYVQKSWVTYWDQRHAMIEQLAHLLRDSPSMPSSLNDLNEPHDCVMDGILWPLVHCAFRGCSWTGEDDGSLQAHIFLVIWIRSQKALAVLTVHSLSITRQ